MIAIVVLTTCCALAVGLLAAWAEQGVDVHRLARTLALKVSGAARRLGLSSQANEQTIGARVLAMCRFEIEELSRAAARSPAAAQEQERRLSAACIDVATKVAIDARAG